MNSAYWIKYKPKKFKNLPNTWFFSKNISSIIIDSNQPSVA